MLNSNLLLKAIMMAANLHGNQALKNDHNNCGDVYSSITRENELSPATVIGSPIQFLDSNQDIR